MRAFTSPLASARTATIPRSLRELIILVMGFSCYDRRVERSCWIAAFRSSASRVTFTGASRVPDLRSAMNALASCGDMFAAATSAFSITRSRGTAFVASAFTLTAPAASLPSANPGSMADEALNIVPSPRRRSIQAAAVFFQRQPEPRKSAPWHHQLRREARRHPWRQICCR